MEIPGNWAWERVLINLFLNAMHAMPQAASIRSGRPAASGSGDSLVQIAVRDSGCGIRPEMLERLFEPGVSTGGSSGLGLHVVRASRRSTEDRCARPIEAMVPERSSRITSRPRGERRPAHA